MTNEKWEAKQLAAAPSRYYGDGGTIHHTNYIDVETYNGKVVAVWFRCAVLPFKQTEIDKRRADEMANIDHYPRLTGIEVLDEN